MYDLNSLSDPFSNYTMDCVLGLKPQKPGRYQTEHVTFQKLLQILQSTVLRSQIEVFSKDIEFQLSFLKVD